MADGIGPQPTYKIAVTAPNNKFAFDELGTLIGFVNNGAETFFPASGSDDNVVAFATGGQANATRLNYNNVRVTVCATLNDSVILPFGRPGMQMSILNAGAQTMRIYPATGDFIDGGVNNPITVATAVSVRLHCHVLGKWRSNPIL